MKASAGDTVLLCESGVCRWVRIVLAAPQRSNGTQLLTVKNLEPYGRDKPRRVVLGSTARIEWMA